MSPTKAPQHTEPARILIVDDQAQNVSLLKRILERAGYENIASTTNPAEAVALKEAFKPDLVLLDLHFGAGTDGFHVLEQLVSNPGGVDHLPVVMITADDSAEVKRRALALGAKDFIGKPFDAAEVLLRIRNLLETRFLYQTLRNQTRAGAEGSRANKGIGGITPRGAGASGGRRRIPR